MIYVSWAVLYEGSTDQRYFDILIPRVIEDLLLNHGRVSFVVPEIPSFRLDRGSNEAVAAQLCEHQEAFYLAFVHSDTGGRNQAANIGSRGGEVGALANELCGFDLSRFILVSPRHEMEAWALADHEAVCSTLGYSGDPAVIGLPTNAQQAEALVDPKATLKQAIDVVRGRRKTVPADRLLPVIAQEQSLDILNASPSFRAFRERVYVALQSLGSVE